MSDETPTPPQPPAPVPPDNQPFWKRLNPHWVGWFAAVVMSAILTYLGVKPSPLPPVPDEPIFHEGGQGWVEDPDAVKSALVAIERAQNMPPFLGRIARDIVEADNDAPWFAWQAEEKVLGKRLGSWDQASAGTCVSFGFARGVQDLILAQIASGAPEKWPGNDVATEPIYGGSRVEVGGGRIQGDGSIGAWAAQWVQKWGILFRQKYGNYDLSQYSMSMSRTWGRKGVPDELEPIAREHPVKTVALVENTKELWGALGNAYPVPVCSSVGFEGQPLREGFCEPRGEWAHCMLFRGRFVHPTKGKSFVIQNSWGNYLRGDRMIKYLDANGRTQETELPEGCFAVRESVAARMLAARDTFALSGFVGFPSRKPLDWFVEVKPSKRPRPDAFAVFHLNP